MSLFNDPQQSLVKVNQDIKRVQASMINKAERSSHAALTALRKEGKKIAALARLYSPFKTGLLDGTKGGVAPYSVIEHKGALGRIYIEVALNKNRWKTVSGRRVSLAKYADIIHSGYLRDGRPWQPGKGTKAKAAILGMSATPTGDGKYVGAMFLYRAAQQRSQALDNEVRRAVQEGLK